MNRTHRWLAGLAGGWALSAAAVAGFDGSTVSGSFTLDEYGTVLQPFSSLPQIVGPQVEFSGSYRGAFDLTYGVSVDVGDDFIRVDTRIPGYPFYVGRSVPLFTARLTFTGASVWPAAQCGGCGGAAVYTPTGASSVEIALYGLTDGASYRFVRAVPEPPAWALWGAGWAALMTMARRRRQASDRIE